GDYMALRFKVADQVFGRREAEQDLRDGHIVLASDARGVATFVRFDEGGALAAGETRLRYRIRAGRVKFATNAFFFQEGHAERYESARYGEFRVAADGEAILTDLCDQNLVSLSDPEQP